MKTLNLWRSILVMVAALSLASCHSDNEAAGPTAEQISQALFDMKNTYAGTLTAHVKNSSNKQTLIGLTATSHEQLILSIPLDLIADQINDRQVADRIREIGFAEVMADYQFIQIDDGTAHFLLQPRVIRGEDLLAVTRTSVVQYQGLTLLFDANYGGTFNGADSSLQFNICVSQILLDGKAVNEFLPVVFSFKGNTILLSLNNEESKLIPQWIEGHWSLDEQIFDGEVQSLSPEIVYIFSEGNYQIIDNLADPLPGRSDMAHGRYAFYMDDIAEIHLYMIEYPEEAPFTGRYTHYQVVAIDSNTLVLRRTHDGHTTTLKFSRILSQ
ncbi:MAG: hypothetical protein IJ539_04370 [Prevotella sp.]|nr:hypothetical protein [Prevotella sp.]